MPPVRLCYVLELWEGNPNIKRMRVHTVECHEPVEAVLVVLVASLVPYEGWTWFKLVHFGWNGISVVPTLVAYIAHVLHVALPR